MSLRLYVPDLQPAAATWILPPGPTRHVQVRRLQPGDTVVLFDGCGAEWDARIEAIGRSQVTVAPGPRREVDRELDLSVTLALGVPALAAAWWLAPGPLEAMLMSAAVVFVWIVELVNSAIEALADAVSTAHHPLLGRAKDIGSAAVMLSLALAVMVWVVVLWPGR